MLVGSVACGVGVGGLVPGTGFLDGLWVAVFVVFGCYSDFAGLGALLAALVSCGLV